MGCVTWSKSVARVDEWMDQLMSKERNTEEDGVNK